MKTIFSAKATNKGGRAGWVKSEKGPIDFEIEMPNANGDSNDNKTNPEQLFAAAYATCFASAIEAVAPKLGVTDLGDFSVTVAISFNKEEEGFFLGAEIDAYLPTVTMNKGEDIINEAHEICPYSKATRDNITVELNLLLDDFDA